MAKHYHNSSRNTKGQQDNNSTGTTESNESYRVKDENNRIIETIYNCSDIRPIKLRPLHQYVNCSVPEGDQEEEMIVLNARYEKLVRHHTPVRLYKCRMFLLQLTCTESWRGVTGDVIRQRKETELQVDSSTCMEAVKTRRSPAGTL